MVKQKTLKHLLGTGILQLRNVHIQLCSVPKPGANMVSPNRSSKHYRWLTCGCSSLSASLQPHSSGSIAISWHLSVLCVLLETTPTFVKASPSCHHSRRSTLSVSVVPSGVALVSLLREWERKTLSRFMVFIFLLKYFKWKTSTLLRKTSHWVGECHNSILMKLIHIPHSLNSVHFKAFSWRLALAKALSLHLRFFL